MQIIIAQTKLPKSMFLAGPTPRNKTIPSWRPKAIDILDEMEKNYPEVADLAITVYTPTDLEGHLFGDKTKQRHWEWEAISIATVIVFWIPRDLATLPGFTTNVEFGFTVAQDKIVLGFPKDSPKNIYLEALAQRFHIPVYHTLEETLRAGVAKLLLPYGGG